MTWLDNLEKTWFRKAKIKPLKIESRLYSHPIIKQLDAKGIVSLANLRSELLELIRASLGMQQTIEDGFDAVESDEGSFIEIGYDEHNRFEKALTALRQAAEKQGEK